MRLFIAINFDSETKENILQVQSRLKRMGRGNFTRPENLHLTLAFLGEVEESRVSLVKAAMDSIPFEPMRLCFGRTGCFRSDSELWWIGINENESLTRLQKDLSAALRKEGFSLESRRFKPHITLARQMHIGRASGSELLPHSFDAEVSCMELMLSHRVDGKLIYTSLYKSI